MNFKVCLAIVIQILFFSATLTLLGCVNSNHLSGNDEKSTDYSIGPKSSLGLLEVVTFDVYVDKQVVHLLVAGSATEKQKGLSIRYTRSEDGGRHWLNPVNLGSTFPQPMATRGNDIQVAAAGDRIVALWQTPGELPGMGPIAGAYSTDGGLTWQAATNPAANNSGDQSHLDLAADAIGNFHAVWLEDPEEQGYQSLRYARSIDAGSHWQTAKTLDDSTCSCCWNTLMVSPADEIFVLYRDMKPRDMALMKSTDHGDTWHLMTSKVGDFNWKFEGCPHVGGGLAYEGSGNSSVIHSIVWTGKESVQGLYYLNSDNGGKFWNKALRLGNAAIHGDIAVSGKNHVSAVWDEMEPEGSSIFSSQSQDAGASWRPAKRLSLKGIMASHPRVVATRFGTVAFWTEKQSKQRSQLALVFLD